MEEPPTLFLLRLCSSSSFILIILLHFGLVLWLELVLAATWWYALCPATISYSEKMTLDETLLAMGLLFYFSVPISTLFGYLPPSDCFLNGSKHIEPEKFFAGILEGSMMKENGELLEVRLMSVSVMSSAYKKPKERSSTLPSYVLLSQSLA
jgi:hypothetical protein